MVVCPWHQYRFHRCTGEGEPGYEADKVPELRREGRERPVVGHRQAGQQTRPPAARAASADAVHRDARAGAAARRRHFDHGDGSEEPALLHLRAPARRGAGACAHGARRRGEDDPAQRPQVPQLRGLLLQGREGLHLAVFDHLDGQDRPARPGVRNGGALGRYPADRHADPLGRGQLALLQDGRAHELHPEPDHAQQQGADPQQGRRVHHHRRPGRHPGRGRPDDEVLQRDRLPLPQFPFIAHSLGWEFEEMDRNVELVENSEAAAHGRARAGDAQRARWRAPARSARSRTPPSSAADARRRRNRRPGVSSPPGSRTDPRLPTRRAPRRALLLGAV